MPPLMGYFSALASPLTYRRLMYLLIGFPLGIFFFTFLVTALSVSVGLLVVWIGVPLLVLSIKAWRAMADFDRHFTSAVLKMDIPRPPDPTVGVTGPINNAKAIMTDISTWRSFTWLLLRFPIGILGFVAAVLSVAWIFATIALPLALVAGADVQPSSPRFVAFWLLPVVGILATPLFAHFINGLGALQGQLARSLLSPTAAQQTAALRRRTSVLEERTRLAHELHDSVGHTLTMIVVQAGAGHHVYDTDPEFGRAALEHIETSGRRALTELDRILGILREEGSEVARAPQAGIDRIQALVDDTARAGIDIRLTVDGPVDQVSSEVGRSAYRIVQEALTNVIKHAGPVPTRVSLFHRGDTLELEVLNDASATPRQAPKLGDDSAGGRGLAGIRERVAMLGGSVQAGPRPEGGFRVWVRLPVDGV
jgi:signal transduction histidine kinase